MKHYHKDKEYTINPDCSIEFKLKSGQVYKTSCRNMVEVQKYLYKAGLAYDWWLWYQDWWKRSILPHL